MTREFKYDVIHLIQGVRDRPCLWDKTLDNYKDRVERRAAWEEIFRVLDDKYDELPREDRRITEELVQQKWANVRDAFVRSLKTKSGRPKRKYILYDHLKFLTKVIPEDEAVEYIEDFSIPSSYIIEEIVERGSSIKKRNKMEDSDEYASNRSKDYSVRKRTRKLEYPDDVPIKSKEENSDTEFIALDETHNSRIMNEDEAFFASLLPTIVKYSEDERLEFRIQVLGVMKRIKEGRKWSKNDYD